jgi:hypothetical protein
MKKCIVFLIIAFLSGSSTGVWAQSSKRYKKNIERLKAQKEIEKKKTEAVEVEDNPFREEEAKKRQIEKERAKIYDDSLRNVQTEDANIDPFVYVMDRRYLHQGDDTLRHWYDNVFFQVGMGLDKIVMQSEDFHQSTTVNVAMGVQLNRYHSLRGTLEGAFGYRKAHTNLLVRGEAKLDHLFDLTSYFDGYRPNRLLSVSSVLGGGLMYSVYNPRGGNIKAKQFAPEAHLGAQLRFYTGPHGYLTVEPYVGLGPDYMNINTSWRKFDIFYGANINYVYYFTNHLSRAARMRLLSEMDFDQKLNFTTVDKNGRDTLLQSWATPWFFEVAAGPVAQWHDYLGVKDNLKHLGHSISLSAGKWFSPVIGMRASLSERSAIYRVRNYRSSGVRYQREYANHYLSARLDGMFNPFGFSKNFDWNAPYGAYVMMGFELGSMRFNYEGNPNKYLRTYSQAYSLGAHGWLKISDGLQFFVEPRIMGHVFTVPYKNVPWKQYNTRRVFMVNFGITATGLSPKYRKKVDVSEADSCMTCDSRWTVGLGVGTNMVQHYLKIHDSESFPYNFNGFAQYHFDKVSSLRLGFEYLSHSASDIASYYYITSVESPVKSGLWNHTYYFGLASVDYGVNLTNLLFGYHRNRKFDIEAFAGPGLCFFFGQNADMNSQELEVVKKKDKNLKTGATFYGVSLMRGVDNGCYFAANGGVKVSYQLNEKLGLYVSPQLQWVPGLKLRDVDAINMTQTRLFETLDLGVQYKF